MLMMYNMTKHGEWVFYAEMVSPWYRISAHYMWGTFPRLQNVPTCVCPQHE